MRKGERSKIPLGKLRMKGMLGSTATRNVKGRDLSTSSSPSPAQSRAAAANALIPPWSAGGDPGGFETHEKHNSSSSPLLRAATHHGCVPAGCPVFVGDGSILSAHPHRSARPTRCAAAQGTWQHALRKCSSALALLLGFCSSPQKAVWESRET